MDYLYKGPETITLGDVLLPSTLLTSTWTFLLLVSSVVLRLITRLRRLTAWWFKIEEHPLTAIGQVFATIIIAGGVVIKAVHWVFSG